MKRLLVAALPLITAAMLSGAEAELPDPEEYESFEVEPPPLLPNRDVDAGKTTALAPRSPRDPEELEKQVERAKRAAAAAEQLYKRGVLSRMEVELRALRIVRLQSDLENARLDRLKAD